MALEEWGGKQNVDFVHTDCLRLPSECTDLEIGFRSQSPASLLEMSGNDNLNQENADCDKNQATKRSTETVELFTIIPKVEPYSPDTCNTSDTTENTLNDDGLMVSPIPFTTPYKIKDPIVLLERCDKIWETLKLIKHVQKKKNSDGTFDALSSGITSSKSYIKYQPVLGNGNAALPNFEFSVKTRKKLYNCSICGKQYSENRTLRRHSERIHNIQIPPQRRRSNTIVQKNIDVEKESHEAEKEKNSHEEPHLKRNETKQLADTLGQSTSLQVTENNTSISLPRKRTRSIQTRLSNSLTTSETIRNEQGKEILNKDSKHNEKSDFSDDDTVQVQCVLCKTFLKDIKRHLTDYHKIRSPDFMLKEMKKVSPRLQNKQLEKLSANNESSDENETTQEEFYSRKRKRRSLNSHKRPNVSQAAPVQDSIISNTRKCEICKRMYGKKNFYKHRRMHMKYGDTAENFHLRHRKYRNSPLSLKGKTVINSCDISSEDTNNCLNNKEDRLNFLEQKGVGEEEIIQKKKKKKDRFSMKNNGKLEITCCCGRLFRNPHTLFIHKSKCRFKGKKGKQSPRKVELNELDESTSGNSYDRDSGIGISITIKKKDNSYEVVGKNDDNESPLQDFRHLKDAEALSEISMESSQADSHTDQQNEISELYKYSEDHKILKLECADEDMDVDIEEDSQSSLCNNNIDETRSNSFKRDQGLETERKNVSINETEKIDEGSNCVCGKTFSTKQAFQTHINEHQQNSQLNCGYCNETFPNITVWIEHECSVKQGGTFVDVPLHLRCPYCSTVLNSYKKFDDHINLKHFDSLLPYQCAQCSKRFPSPWFRRMHCKECHSKPDCPICKMACPDTLKSKHDGYHYGLGFPCHICKKTYPSLSNVLTHKSSVHLKIGLNNVLCDICNLHFADITDFNVHKGYGKCGISTRKSKKRILNFKELES